MSKVNDFIKDNIYVFKLAGSILGIIVLFITVDSYLDSKIENKITDADYIKKLSNQLRPFLVFNEKGIVTYDHGAFNKIKQIVVNDKDEYVIIETSEFLQTPPLLISLGANHYSFKVEQIDSKKWRYNFLYNQILISDGGSKEQPNTIFMLEVLQ